MYVLGGLGPEYDAVVVYLTTRAGLPSIPEVHAILQAHEMRILHNSGMTQSTFPSSSSSSNVSASANIASKDSKGNYKSKGKGKYPGKTKVVCQLCGKNNHVSAKCYKRFDTSFHGLEHNQNQASTSTSPGQAAQANIEQTFNHDFSHSPYNYTATNSSSPAMAGSEWYVDSGATHHITSQLGNMNLHQPYQGTSTLVVGNVSSTVTFLLENKFY